MKGIFKQFSAGFALLALTGCAVWETRESAENEQTVPASSSEQAEQAALAPKLPDIDLDGKLLFTLLSGELAGHRGDLDLAASQYLQAAHLTRDPRIIERAVQVANFAKRYAEGLEAARLWVEVAPDLLTARYTYATMLLRNNLPDAAYEEFDFIIKAKEAEPSVFIAIGKQLARESMREVALGIMQRLARSYRHIAAAHYALSTLAEQSGKLKLAESAVRESLTLKPDWLEAKNQLARLLHLQGETTQALDILRKALDAEPDSKVLRLNYARLLVDAKQLDAARVEFEHLAEQAPGNEDILYALGILALQSEDLDAAERYMKQLAGDSKRSLEAAYYLGQIAEQREQPLKAIRWYAEIQRGEYAFDAQMRMVGLLAKQGDIDAALNHLKSILPRGEAQQVRLYLVEGDVLRVAERYEDAMTLYNQALEKLPGNNDLLYARALMAERVDRLDILIADLQTVLKSEPDNAHAMNALGYTLADRTTRFEEASKYIHRALELLPDDPAILDSMGWLQYRIGNHDEAIKHLTRAYDLNDDGEIAAHLGEVLWVMGEQQRAQKIWQRALEKAPGDKKVLEAMQRLAK
ncbi:MAG: tetratricopeptide repeat protein [Gammaproteobacteria bacterium]|nr:tetratricopeptide repeat protein [Gammaproteobacteria bacterium]